MQYWKNWLISAAFLAVGIVLIIIGSTIWMLIGGITLIIFSVIAFLYLLNKTYHFIKVEITMLNHKSNTDSVLSTFTAEDVTSSNGFVMSTGGVLVVPKDINIERDNPSDEENVVEEQITPTITIARKSLQINKQIFELQTNSDAASILFSIDGGNYVTYRGPVVVENNCLLSAYAQLGDKKSAILKEQIKGFKVEVPSITIIDRTVQIKTNTACSTIYYTLDGKDPSESSSLYKSDFQISKSCEIKAIATKDKWDNSEIACQLANIVPSKEERIRKFTNEENVIGISYRGNSHIKSDSPCQDFHSFSKLGNDWNIAIVSDGAGSAKHSDEGSRAVCAAFKYYIENLIKKDTTLSEGKVLDAKTWDIEFKGMLTQFQNDLKKNFVKAEMPFESFAATIIVLLYSKNGYMIAHVGDGRAGIRVNGVWSSAISPHKGEEANQTIFSTSKYLGEKIVPNLKMSGIYVPETNVSKDRIDAFVLMSDGCENGAWITYQRRNLPNGDFRVEDVNMPRVNSIEEFLHIIDLPSKDRQSALVDLITESTSAFKNEPDDKTILIGKVL